MLILTRRPAESIRSGEEITITILGIKGGTHRDRRIRAADIVALAQTLPRGFGSSGWIFLMAHVLTHKNKSFH
jgi:hypothetical protein